MIVFLVCGFWHGEQAGFVVWGLLHGLYSLADGFYRRRGIRILREGLTGRILTFWLVTFAWIFFRLPSGAAAFRYVGTMLTAGPRLHSFIAEFAAMGLTAVEAWVIVILLAGILLAESLAYHRGRALPQLLAGRHYLVRYAAILLLAMVIVIFGIYGPAYDSSRMIYMQF